MPTPGSGASAPWSLDGISSAWQANDKGKGGVMIINAKTIINTKPTLVHIFESIIILPQ
jgi:hypothetical protein